MCKRLIYITFLVLIISGCQSDKPAAEETETKELSSQSAETANASKTLDVPWIAVYNDSTHLLEMKKNPAGEPENLNQQDIIDALNLKYPNIKLEIISREGNKILVKIDDAEFLTREMGSTGARSYMAEATYSLTELEGVEAVDFRFTQGDHAMPGIFTRRSFENFN